MTGKDHEHRPDFYRRALEVHGARGRLSFLRAHLAIMHDQKGLGQDGWDVLVAHHDRLHGDQLRKDAVAPHHHHHDQPDGDLVTYHAEHSPQQVARHLEHAHGFAWPPPLGSEYRVHAEQHALALTDEEKGKATEADKRAAIGHFLRELAAKRLGETEHVHLPPSGVSLVATDSVQEWLEEWATRAENGATP